MYGINWVHCTRMAKLQTSNWLYGHAGFRAPPVNNRDVNIERIISGNPPSGGIRLLAVRIS